MPGLHARAEGCAMVMWRRRQKRDVELFSVEFMRPASPEIAGRDWMPAESGPTMQPGPELPARADTSATALCRGRRKHDVKLFSVEVIRPANPEIAGRE